MRERVFAVIIVVVMASLAYAQTPADAKKPVSQNAPIKIPLSKAPKAKIIKPQPPQEVVLDARPFFEYSTSHVEKSQFIRWEDYAQTEEPFRGLLEPNLSIIARKLRSLGISPQTKVIVLGNGTKGNGEEGRIAWMLRYVGVKQVKTQVYSDFQGKRVTLSTADNWAAPVWIPRADDKIRIRKTELEKDLKNYKLVDVRSPEAFKEGTIPGAINIPWAQFATQNVRQLLASQGVAATSPIVFFSQKGVESAYATFISNEAGIDAKNFDGGYIQWKNQTNP